VGPGRSGDLGVSTRDQAEGHGFAWSRSGKSSRHILFDWSGPSRPEYDELMSSGDFMPLEGWDHVELWVGNAKQAAYFYEHALGFTTTAYAGPETGVRDRASYVLEQGEIRLVVTSGLRADSEVAQFASRHGDGAKTIALQVPSAAEAYRQAVQRGARGIEEPRWVEDDFGRVELAAIGTYGEVVHCLVNRHEYAGPFLPGFVSSAENGHARGGVGLTALDHVVGNVELGRMDHWVGFYERVFGMTNIVHFGDDQIQTEYSALMSKVMADGSGKIKFPINEPAEGKRKSQIEEYLEFNHGPGVQHIALQSEDIVRSVEAMKERGVLFLDTPDAYYEEVEGRVGEIGEDYSDLRRLKILADRDEDGYLLQIFTKTAQDRPTVFFEVIERHGATTFGEGNFKALFESIEREQALRGNL
jgi:4-hydroxyphenylpyruvate dioxygenase